MKQHPLSAAFPSMPADELATLAEDIKANGLREPGIIFEGKIIDGWHRYQACEKAGVAFKHFPLPAGRDPVAYVLSRNAHRRHLTASQKAAAVALCFDWRAHGGNQRDLKSLRTQTDAELAHAAGVSEKTVERAKTAIRAGLAEEVKSGKVSVNKAVEIAKLPAAKRQAAIDAPTPKPKPKKPGALEAENARLKDDLDQMSENLPELFAMASAAEAFKNDEHFTKIVHLETELAQVKRSRDDCMRENAELKRQNSFLQRKLKKLEGK